MSSGGLRRVPDPIGPIVGYRVWGFVTAGRTAVLEAPMFPSGSWADASRGWVVSSCMLQGDPEVVPRWALPVPRHLSPDESCSCGFYALKSIDRAASILADQRATRTLMTGAPGWEDLPGDGGMVLGRVTVAGKVIEHAHGYRAQKARVLELIPTGPDDDVTVSVARGLALPVADPYAGPFDAMMGERLATFADFWEYHSTPSARYAAPSPPPVRQPPTLLEQLRLLTHRRAFRVIQGGPIDDEDSS